MGARRDEGDAGALVALVQLDPSPPGSCAATGSTSRRAASRYRHTHPGPGIRTAPRRASAIETEGRSTIYGPGGAWFESGPEPVVRGARPTELETAFVRVLVLPAEWAGKRTIRYVDPADEEKPKLQRATVFLEHPISLPL